MTVLVWRLHRRQAYMAGIALGVVTTVLLVTGIRMAHDYNEFVATCAATSSCSSGDQLFSGDGLILDLVYASMAVPLLFGLFWGGPLLAQELETGTHNLVWTQGVTKRRWLLHTVGWIVLAAALWGAALAALVTWWHSPENALEIPTARLSTGMFDIQGVVPVAYSVFAVALGIAAGALFRRVLPAMATTLAAFVVARVLVADFVRPHYLPAVTIRRALQVGLSAAKGVRIGPGGGPPPGAWVLSSDIVTPAGQTFSHGLAGKIPLSCHGLDLPACVAGQGAQVVTRYQPASRFWAFQGIESAIFLALAALLVFLACQLILRRDA